MPEENAEQQKPVGPFDDFEACVQHFQGDPEVDDPEALCGWMEENAQASAVQEYQPDADEVEALVQAMKDPAASSVLTDLEVTFVSGVGDPAQDSQWVMAKDAAQERGADWGVTAPLVLQKGTAVALDEDEQDGEQQKAWAPVLIPNETDKQGDVIPPEAIEKAAHDFLAQFRNIDTDHDLLEGKGTPIESWTLKESSTFTLPDGSESREYQKGTWMLGVEFSDEAWDRIKSGDLTGFSIYGEATEHSVSELLGDGVDLEMGGTTSPMQATAKEADTHEEPMENEPDSGDEGEDLEKALPEEAVQMLSGSVDAMLAAEDAEPDEVQLDEFIQWALDNGEFETDSVIVGGVEFTAEGGGGSEDSDGGGEEQPEETPDEQAEPAEQQMENENPEDGPDEGETSTKELLEDVRDTVKSTQESVEQHGERISDLEDAVFEKDEGEQEASEAEQPEDAPTDEVEVEQAASEAAEAEVKSLLGLDELPDDPDERQEVVRKHLHEQDEDSGLGSPDSWSEDEVSEVVR